MMKITTKLLEFFKRNKPRSAPLLIITKESDDARYSEYRTIEKIITEIENNSTVPKEKIETLKSLIKNLKNKTLLQIKDGEIVK